MSDWATSNNLCLNRSKEIFFVNKQKKHKFNIPKTFDKLKCVQNIKILGITFTNGLSVTPLVQHLAISYAQALYALKNSACTRPMRDGNTGSFHSVILEWFLYASPAWWSFAGARDRQKVSSYLCRSVWVVFSPIYQLLTTYASKPTKIYSIKFYIIQTTFSA